MQNIYLYLYIQKYYVIIHFRIEHLADQKMNCKKEKGSVPCEYIREYPFPSGLGCTDRQG